MIFFKYDDTRLIISNIYKMRDLFISALTVTLFLIFAGCSEKRFILAEKNAVENGLLPAIQVEGYPVATFNLSDRMEYYNVPGVSIAIVKDGRLRWAEGYGFANTENGQMVDENTLFQAASISKPIAALGVLMLAEEGMIDIHADVNNYLNEWKIPDNDFSINEKVTAARLLSHTAGVTVHGFPGYNQSDNFPSVIEVLEGEGNTPRIYVDTIPGALWRYSGGGYTIMEKVVEDVTGISFEDFMSENILKPTGMENSTYEQPLPEHLHAAASAAYNRQGEIIEGLWHNYPERAAAGLWTTPSDLARYCMEIQNIISGSHEGILTRESVSEMLTKQKNDWGLGPSLRWDADSLIFEHGGKNAGFTNSLVAFANRGDAVIVMTNGDNARELINEILRSVSDYYNWGISYPEIAVPVEITEDELEIITGNFSLMVNEEILLLEFEKKENRLYVAANGMKKELIHIGGLQFVSEDGDRFLFRSDNGSGINILLLNRSYRFQRTD